MLKVGITGGIGSGKSLVCDVFKLFGIPVYHADWEAKKLYDDNKELADAIVSLFGIRMRTDDGKINKKELAAIIFSDAKALQAVNQLVHPLVALHFDNWCQLNQSSPYIIKEAAILFESDAYLSMDKIITVTAPVDVRIQIAVLRDGASAGQIEERISKQSSDEYKVDRSDWVIVNNGKQLIIPMVYKIHRLLIESAR